MMKFLRNKPLIIGFLIGLALYAVFRILPNAVFFWFLGILAGLLGIIAILLILPIRLEITVQDKKSTFSVRILGINLTRRFSPEKVAKKAEKAVEKEIEVEVKDEDASTSEKIHDVKRKIYMARHILQEMRQKLFRKIVFERFVLKIRFGDGNAATTGIEAGLIWAVIGGLLAVLNNTFTFKTNADIAVLPEFNQKMFDLYIDGIIRTRLVHIMIAGIVAITLYKKYENK